MTKQFTAVCILKLAQEKKLSLTDDIKVYLPYYNTHSKTITIENLLTTYQRNTKLHRETGFWSKNDN